MAWIEVHEELRTHPKVTRLARELGVSKAESRGLVIGLFLWACTYAPDGDLSRIESLDLADGCDYEGSKDFKAALVVARFIDQEGDRYVIHDWDQMGLKMLTSSQARQKKYRERVDAASTQSEPESTSPPENVIVTSPKRNGDVEVTSYLTIPNHNQKETAEDTHKTEKPSAAAPEVRKPETIPPKRDTMALVTKLVQEHTAQDFSWLEGMLLHEWGREGRVGAGVNETLRTLGKQHGIDRLKYAIHEAARHGKKSLAYVEAILVPKEKESAVDTTKACRQCGHRWDPLVEAKVTGSSLCPVCYPEEHSTAERRAL